MVFMIYKMLFTEAVIKDLRAHISSERDSKIYHRLRWLDLKIGAMAKKKLAPFFR